MDDDTRDITPEPNGAGHVAAGPDAGAEVTDARARERREALDAFWVTVRRLPTYARLIAALLRDRRVSNRARAVLAVGGAYAVSPIDLVPGIIPVAGQMDDVYVALMATRQALRMVPAEVAEEALLRYGLDESTIDSDLATIRRLVRIGVTDGARWSWSRLDRLGRRVGDAVARSRSERR
jgi:uncharacterized membrane protein YkvA (DUF1232 family)